MAATPAFQFYPADFLVGTAEMTADEVGGYIRLLCYQWTKGELPNSDKKLMQLSGVYTIPELNTIKSKFEVRNNGTIVNLKMEKVRDEQVEYREKQREKANKRWESKPNAAALPEHMPVDMPEACPSPSSLSSTTTSSIPLPSKKDLMLSRKKVFASTLEPFVSVYGKEMMNDFYKYWTEHNKSETKFKQELEKTWSLERRLETWNKNDFNKTKGNGTTTQPPKRTLEDQTRSVIERIHGKGAYEIATGQHGHAERSDNEVT